MVNTTTPETKGGIYLRIWGIKNPKIIWNKPPIKEAPKTAANVAPLFKAPIKIPT